MLFYYYYVIRCFFIMLSYGARFDVVINCCFVSFVSFRSDSVFFILTNRKSNNQRLSEREKIENKKVKIHIKKAKSQKNIGLR
jgi:hypothetical protein